jgi:hypothetical protein
MPSHTHQQNETAERKHHHIVDIGLSLLARAGMPLKFWWDEAYLTATIIINCTSSRLVGLQTPKQRLLNHKPDYALLCTFRCACWPNLWPYSTHNLSFRSKHFMFLGHSNQHKGYKCLDPSSGQVYISHDIIFDETVFPFSTLHPNAGAHLKKWDISSSSNVVHPSLTASGYTR